MAAIPSHHHTWARRCFVLVIAAASLAVTAVAEDRTGGSGLAQLIGPPQPPLQYGFPPQPYSAPDSWAGQDEQPQGFTVQSGYSGLVVPETGTGGDSGLGALHRLGGVALGASLLAHLLPFPFNKIALVLGSKVGLWVLGIGTLLLLGGAATTALCALTPICTISFLGFGLTRESTRALLTKDRLDAAARFVREAVHKWTELQKRGEPEEENKKREARKRKKASASSYESATTTPAAN